MSVRLTLGLVVSAEKSGDSASAFASVSISDSTAVTVPASLARSNSAEA